ncbi:hypothetical protein VW23_013945 [Devosia insulae DS-56]|uniref:Uncharacterized protein n=1 Tax=Devosia insulae DS-56 TaxID=1116389 RepID=A0A1E5XTM4_9HYPH|nr:hypothetical protein VW23_013945 [Devosia insulae DS-56]
MRVAASNLRPAAAAIILTLPITPVQASAPCPYVFSSGVEGIVLVEDAVVLYFVGAGPPDRCPIVGHEGSIVSVDCGYSTWTFQLISSVPDGETNIMVIGKGSDGAPIPGPLYKRCDVDPESLGFD